MYYVLYNVQIIKSYKNLGEIKQSTYDQTTLLLFSSENHEGGPQKLDDVYKDQANKVGSGI